MRRLVISILAAGAIAAALLAARYASHLLVYDYVQNNYSFTKGPHTFADVSGHFGEVVDDMVIVQPLPSLFPYAKVVGLIELPTILLISLILPLIPLCWTATRRLVQKSRSTRPKD